MKRLPITEEHIRKLEEYGLQNVPRDAYVCLRFAPGETVLYEGEPIRWYSIVISGRAKVCRNASNGRMLTLYNYDSNGMIGEIELLTDKEITETSVIAVTDFECIVIDYPACRTELKNNAKFLYKLGSVLAQKLSQSANSFSAAALYSGKQRLCFYILQAENRNVFSDVLTDVACSIGMSYRHMFRLLGELCAEDVLEKRENGYLIKNPGRLKQLAAMDVAPAR